MPRLENMEVWGLAGENRLVYLVEDRRHTIFVPQNMVRTLSRRTIRCWERVVALRGTPLDLKVEGIPEDDESLFPTMLGDSATYTTVLQLERASKRRLAAETRQD